jgi:hypothetical protein
VKASIIENSNRIYAIDFTKGILVLFMDLYRSLNYLGDLVLPHKYLIFVPTSFIMITGFIISQIYARKYAVDMKSISLRLGIRSLKLLLLFTALNLSLQVVYYANNNGLKNDIGNYLQSWIAKYLLSNGKLQRLRF